MQLIKLITITLILLSAQCSANYAEIGYTKNLSLDTLVRIDSVFYLQANKSRDVESVGVGVGYKIKSLNMVLTLNSEGENTNAQFNAMYYDRGMPYFVGVKQSLDADKKISFKIGLGYPINEKVSIVTHYSESGLFLGIRRWL